jgi:hypothetical protein
MGIKIKSFVVAVAVVGVGLAGAQTASAATGGPTVKLTQPTFQSIVPDGDAYSYPQTWDVHFTLPWTVSAPNRVCGQTITDQDYNDLGGDVDPILGYSTAAYTLPQSARFYSGGDGYWLDFFRGGYNAVVRVTDCHGVTAASNAVHTVLQPGDNTDSAIVYSRGGGWKTAKCTCFLGGNSTYTQTKNAGISFLTAPPIDATGIRLALLMPTGPGRGSAALYVDGVKKAIINTYHAGSNVNGKITYQVLIPGRSVHQVKIVNLATPGHPRIDLDATINGG